MTRLLNDHLTAAGHEEVYQHMAIQVYHNLQHEHRWTHLRIHNHSSSGIRLPRPVISGTPAGHVYMHPDDQIDMLKQGLKDQDVPIRCEWVLPTHLEEKWSIKKLSEIFDALDHNPPESTDNPAPQGPEQLQLGPTRAKRVLLAIIGDDSTIVYYIVHDGIVKPRQN